MKKFFKWVGIGLLVLVGVVWLYIEIAYPTLRARYSMSVAVDTPAGIRSATNVYETVGEFHIKFLPQWRDFSGFTRGEAVVVEVVRGKYLFVLLKSDNKRPASISGFRMLWSGGDLSRYQKVTGRRNHQKFPWKAANALKGKRIVNPVHLPLLVTFTDITDPSSVKRVDPDDLESHFGAGVVLKGVTLEVTREKVTKGEVEKVLGWLDEYREKQYRLTGESCVACGRLDSTFVGSLSASSFKIGK